MANIQISQLGDGGALQDTDQIPIVRGASNYKITGNQIAKNVITTQGDLIIGNASAIADRLSIGSSSQVLTSNGTVPGWQDLPTANITTQGITQLATQTEYFNKDSAKTITSDNITNDVRQASFSIANKSYNGVQQTDAGDSATWLSIAAPQLIPTDDETLDGTGIFVPGLNLLGTMLSANEANTDLVDYTGFEFKDTTNALLNGDGTWFNDADKKWLAPSPLNTFNQGSNKKLFFRVRIPEFVITTENSFNGNAMYLYIRLLRYNFNAQDRKIISQIPIVLSEITSTANIPYTFLYSTNIKGEADPFVSPGNGFYMDIIKSNKSSAGNSAYLRHVRIDIERN